jgi:PTH1 family peptidyl-tRNA hydrolase
MKIIIGLGNPGKEYTHTRHNAGFLALDYFLESQAPGETFSYDKKFNADIAIVQLEGEKIFLVKPQTFMNNSGESVQKIASYFGVNTKEEITVIYDEIDIPFGKIKITGNSAGGHKGMQSIIDQLGTDEIYRVRIGIANDHSKQSETAHFVLREFSKEEKEMLPKILKKASREILLFARN